MEFKILNKFFCNSFDNGKKPMLFIEFDQNSVYVKINFFPYKDDNIVVFGPNLASSLNMLEEKLTAKFNLGTYEKQCYPFMECENNITKPRIIKVYSEKGLLSTNDALHLDVMIGDVSKRYKGNMCDFSKLINNMNDECAKEFNYSQAAEQSAVT